MIGVERTRAAALEHDGRGRNRHGDRVRTPPQSLSGPAVSWDLLHQGVVAVTALDRVIMPGTEGSEIKNWRYNSVPEGTPGRHGAVSE